MRNGGKPKGIAFAIETDLSPRQLAQCRASGKPKGIAFAIETVFGTASQHEQAGVASRKASRLRLKPITHLRYPIRPCCGKPKGIAFAIETPCTSCEISLLASGKPKGIAFAIETHSA